MKKSLLFVAVVALIAAVSCTKEEVYTPANISGTWVFSARSDGSKWVDQKVSSIMVFNGKGSYTMKSLPTGSPAVSFSNGRVDAQEKDFSRAIGNAYKVEFSGAKYRFESIDGLFTLVSSTDDLMTFDFSGSTSVAGYKFERVKGFNAELPLDDPDDGTGKINGSKIAEGNDLAGVVLDKSTGKGIPKVIVTDGYNCAKTDANGVYQFKSNPLTRYIYYTTPAEYKIAIASAASVPVFYETITPKAGELTRTDFILEPLPGGKETNWTFVGIGDPQCATSSNANRYTSETIPDIKKTLANRESVYAMTLGDIVFDSTNMWPTMKASMSSVYTGKSYILFFQTIGNHDHDSLKPDTSDDAADDYNATSTFSTFFGPCDYSFDRGDVHVVSMDDIIVSSKKSSSKSNKFTWNYSGGFTDKQFEWLKQDISLVENKEEKMIFICCHIPFRGSSSNHYNDVLKLMDQFKEAHLMIGHTHYTQNYVYTSSHKGKGGLPLYEHIHGSACGAWWTSTCSSTVTGEPSGYTVYDIEGAHIKDWRFKGTKREENFQLRVFDGNEIYYASGTFPLNWYTPSQKVGSYSFSAKGNANLKGCFVAQVFNDDDTYWSVVLKKKSTGQILGNFKRLANGSCSNAAMSAHYYNSKNKSSDSYRSWTASHYWYYKPASANPLSESDWEVEAIHTLPGGQVKHSYTCSTITVTSDLQKEFYF